MVINAVLGSGEDAWIGVSDIQTEGRFVWVDGVASTNENTGWFIHQPSNGGPTGNEDCVHINWHAFPHNTANDLECSQSAFALCEKPIGPQV